MGLEEIWGSEGASKPSQSSPGLLGRVVKGEMVTFTRGIPSV